MCWWKRRYSQPIKIRNRLFHHHIASFSTHLSYPFIMTRLFHFPIQVQILPSTTASPSQTLTPCHKTPLDPTPLSSLGLMIFHFPILGDWWSKDSCELADLCLCQNHSPTDFEVHQENYLEKSQPWYLFNQTCLVAETYHRSKVRKSLETANSSLIKGELMY